MHLWSLFNELVEAIDTTERLTGFSVIPYSLKHEAMKHYPAEAPIDENNIQRQGQDSNLGED